MLSLTGLCQLQEQGLYHNRGIEPEDHPGYNYVSRVVKTIPWSDVIISHYEEDDEHHFYHRQSYKEKDMSDLSHTTFCREHYIQEVINGITITFQSDGRVDTRNAATYLGMGLTDFMNLRRRGKGPRHLKFGPHGKIVYFINDLDQWRLDQKKSALERQKLWNEKVYQSREERRLK